jgi:hypothetical protein
VTSQRIAGKVLKIWDIIRGYKCDWFFKGCDLPEDCWKGPENMGYKRLGDISVVGYLRLRPPRGLLERS